MSNFDIQGKSFKMWVHEICVKQLVQPKWETKDACPGQVPPRFICRCSITYTDKVWQAEGTGKTKKEAEQEAAREMLFTKFEMTPAKLSTLGGCKKEGGSSTMTSSATAPENPGGVGVEGELPVSDTDEAELQQSGNPIGDLLALCSSNDFNDPEYVEVNMEGPPHKRIFTMSCSINEVHVEKIGRRHQKKMAKKLAAFRALREMNARGYVYRSNVELMVQTDSVPTENETKMDDSPDFQSYLEKLSVKGVPVGNEEKFAELIGIPRVQCNDLTEQCLQYCVDYPHAFKHLNSSETIDTIMEDPSNLVNQDSVGLLEKICEELGGAQVNYYDVGIIKDEFLVFVNVRFPFNFNTKLPDLHTFHGEGNNENAAKTNAAKKAIEFIVLMMIEK